MNGTLFHLKIVTADETVYDNKIVSLVVPGALGSLGVLAHHAPLVTPLVCGTIVIRDGQRQTSKYQIEKGFLEVSSNQANILAENIHPDTEEPPRRYGSS